MNLLDEIRSDLVHESASLSNTLRKAKILASAINLPEFRDWVEFELNGYKDRESVPDYRRVRPTNLGTLSGPFGRMDKNVRLPTFNLPEGVKDFAENYTFFEGVGELEAQAARAPIYNLWPQEFLILAREVPEWTGGMALVDAVQPIPAHAILGILDQVKNKLLDFVLRLQENDITMDNINRQKATPETVRNLFNISIHGNQNTITSGENVNQTTNTVQQGGADSLLNYLRELNVDDDDIREIADAVSEEPTSIDGQFGPKVRSWLGGMMGKLTSGTLAVGINTTSTMLAQALNNFYGINPQG